MIFMYLTKCIFLQDKENIPDDKQEVGLFKTKLSGFGGYSAPLKDSGNVAVTLTLSSAAAEDICGVLSALADLLKIPIPASYEIVERTATPPSQKLGLYRRCEFCVKFLMRKFN